MTLKLAVSRSQPPVPYGANLFDFLSVVAVRGCRYKFDFMQTIIKDHANHSDSGHNCALLDSKQ